MSKNGNIEDIYPKSIKNSKKNEKNFSDFDKDTNNHTKELMISNLYNDSLKNNTRVFSNIGNLI